MWSVAGELVAPVIFVIAFVAAGFVFPVFAARVIQAIGLKGDWTFRLACGLITAGTFWLSERSRIKGRRWAQWLLLIVGTVTLCLLIFTPS